MAKRWYVVHVYSGFEKKIAQQIKEQAVQKGLADQIDEVLVPSEDVVELRRGQKVHADRKLFPGYVLVKMELTDET
jgi:transcriptional antiterminator NusG